MLAMRCGRGIPREGRATPSRVTLSSAGIGGANDNTEPSAEILGLEQNLTKHFSVVTFDCSLPHLVTPRVGVPAKSVFYTLTLSIRIANPHWGCSSYTSHSQAERLVSAGTAKVLSDGSLYLVDQRRLDWRNDIRRATDGAGGLARPTEMQRVPVLMHERLLTRFATPARENPKRAAFVSSLASRIRNRKQHAKGTVC